MKGKQIPFSSPLAGAGHYHASRLRVVTHPFNIVSSSWELVGWVRRNRSTVVFWENDDMRP
jgi:hypothetical protein